MFLGFWTFAVASRMDVQYRQYKSIGTECVDSCDGLVMAPFGRWQRAYCSLESQPVLVEEREGRYQRSYQAPSQFAEPGAMDARNIIMVLQL